MPRHTPRHRLPAIALTGLMLVLLSAMPNPHAALATDAAGDISEPVRLKNVPGSATRVDLIALPDDEGHRFRIMWEDGRVETLSPDQFAAVLYDDHSGRSLLYRILNITTPIGIAWVTVGMLGQLLFTGRMLVQWLVSEKSKRSVVPTAFWWMSLTGGLMLAIYFMWRKDIVGIVGQSTGIFIYARNLMLIHRCKVAKATLEEDPAPQPALEVVGDSVESDQT
jgi:lipid-A-disaccharide synthase-like uncharacterized protein